MPFFFQYWKYNWLVMVDMKVLLPEMESVLRNGLLVIYYLRNDLFVIYYFRNELLIVYYLRNDLFGMYYLRNDLFAIYYIIWGMNSWLYIIWIPGRLNKATIIDITNTYCKVDIIICSESSSDKVVHIIYLSVQFCSYLRLIIISVISIILFLVFF